MATESVLRVTLKNEFLLKNQFNLLPKSADSALRIWYIVNSSEIYDRQDRLSFPCGYDL